MNRRRAAAFLDRDGTIIVDRAYASRAQDVELLPGVPAAIARLNQAGVPVILVTNQSGIGRGYLTDADFDEVQDRMRELLEAAGARLDAVYMCPHAPSASSPCECRKPAPLLFRRAIEEHALDARCSWAAGDRWRDLAPLVELGGRGVLVPNPATPRYDLTLAREHASVTADLNDAVSLILDSLEGEDSRET